MQSDLKMQEFAARLSLLETLTRNLLLDRAYYFPAPYRFVDDVREKTISSLRQTSVPEGADIDTAMRVQTLMIEYAEQYFESLCAELQIAIEERKGENT